MPAWGSATSSEFSHAAGGHAVINQAYEDFAAPVAPPRTLRQDNRSTHRNTNDLLKDFMKQCYELDDAMEIFRVLDTTLFRDYRTARKVGKSGGGKKKNDEAGQ